jgi:drug/metabolite transporter (DMT)-like permease
MSGLLWVVVVASTLAWAVFDVIRKRLAGKIRPLELSLWLCVVQVPFYVAWWLATWGPTVPEAVLSPGYLVPVLASAAFNVLANLLFLSAIGRADLGATVPLLSLTPVFVALGSLPLLGERLALHNWLGILLVTLGALFLPDTGQVRPSLRARFQALVSTRASAYMIATALLWALTPVCDKLALAHVPVPVHATLLTIGVGLGTWLLLTVLRQPSSRAGARIIPTLLVAGAVNVLALGLQFVAITSVVVSVFEAFKRAAGLLLALGMGALVFRERLTLGRLAAGGVMACGVVLVLLTAG